MKIQFNFADSNEIPNGGYEYGFTIVGTTQIPKTDIIEASQKTWGMAQIKNQILTELVALLQMDLYGKIIESGGDKPNEKKKIQKIQIQERPDSPVVDEPQVPATEDEEPHGEIGQDQEGTE